MKKLAFVAVALSVALSQGAERYKDRLFDVSVEKDVVYASNVNHLKTLTRITQTLITMAGKGNAIYLYDNENDLEEVDLHMDVYSPKGDSVKNRPAVLVMHGGAFAAGSKEDLGQQTVAYCDSLAARGFVAISVQYRLGLTATIADAVLTVDSLDFSRTVYRGIQDVRAAVRYVRQNADSFGVDPGRIYLVGNSAGAVLALENIYVDRDDEVPEVVHRSPDLGTLDAYGVQGDDSRANAAVSLWGAIHDISIIENASTPVLLVHGTADSTVLFKTGRSLENAATALSSFASKLGLFGVQSMKIETPTLYGSYAIDSALTAKGIEHETYFAEGMPHEFYDEDGYGDIVRGKVFDFLYAQAKGPKTTPVIGIVAIRPSQVRLGEENANFFVTAGQNLRYAVTDLRGRVRMRGTVSAGMVVPFESLERGVYVLRVEGERPLRFGRFK